MPIHDWTKVDVGVFHDFHQSWTIAICRALNAGLLPPDYFAMADQLTSGPIPDVVTLKRQARKSHRHSGDGADALLDSPPKTRFVRMAEPDIYASKANRIAIKHRHGEVVAMIEIVSPGNKSSRTALRQFVSKADQLIRSGVHLLVVDLFPPDTRNPDGIHEEIWDEIQEEPFELPAEKQLTLVSYFAGDPPVAYVEPVAVGDLLPPMPIFLGGSRYVNVPLDESYQLTWVECPEQIQELSERASP